MGVIDSGEECKVDVFCKFMGEVLFCYLLVYNFYI